MRPFFAIRASWAQYFDNRQIRHFCEVRFRFLELQNLGIILKRCFSAINASTRESTSFVLPRLVCAHLENYIQVFHYQPIDLLPDSILSYGVTVFSYWRSSRINHASLSRARALKLLASGWPSLSKTVALWTSLQGYWLFLDSRLWRKLTRTVSVWQNLHSYFKWKVLQNSRPSKQLSPPFTSLPSSLLFAF